MQMFSLEFCLTALCFEILSLYLLSEVSKFHQYGYNKCGTHTRVFSQNFSMAKVRMKQDIETEKKCEKRNVNMEAKRGGKKDFRTANCSSGLPSLGVATPRSIRYTYVDVWVLCGLACFPCSSGRPSCAQVASHLERGGMPLHDAVGVNCKNGATTVLILF